MLKVSPKRTVSRDNRPGVLAGVSDRSTACGDHWFNTERHPNDEFRAKLRASVAGNIKSFFMWRLTNAMSDQIADNTEPIFFNVGLDCMRNIPHCVAVNGLTNCVVQRCPRNRDELLGFRALRRSHNGCDCRICAPAIECGCDIEFNDITIANESVSFGNTMQNFIVDGDAAVVQIPDIRERWLVILESRNCPKTGEDFPGKDIEVERTNPWLRSIFHCLKCRSHGLASFAHFCKVFCTFESKLHHSISTHFQLTQAK